MNFSYKSYPQIILPVVIHRLDFHFPPFFDHFLIDLMGSSVKQVFVFEKFGILIIYIYIFKCIDIFLITTYNIYEI